MEEFLNILVTGIMDAIEEFFEALTVPSRKYTLYAFFVSLVFLAWSVIALLFNLSTFVNWQEALTCSILLLIIVMIDSSTRSKIANNMKGIKSLASRFSYDGDEVENEYDEYDNEVIDQEEVYDESGE